MVAGFNAALSALGRDPVHLSIGAHYGPVIIGDIGTERRMELATLGDTVNVASRLEEMTRQFETSAIVSGDLFGAAAEQNADTALLQCWHAPEMHKLRGRERAVAICRRKSV